MNKLRFGVSTWILGPPYHGQPNWAVVLKKGGYVMLWGCLPPSLFNLLSLLKIYCLPIMR